MMSFTQNEQASDISIILTSGISRICRGDTDGE
jgi:hypothetical protein